MTSQQICRERCIDEFRKQLCEVVNYGRTGRIILKTMSFGHLPHFHRLITRIQGQKESHRDLVNIAQLTTVETKLYTILVHFSPSPKFRLYEITYFSSHLTFQLRLKFNPIQESLRFHQSRYSKSTLHLFTNYKILTKIIQSTRNLKKRAYLQRQYPVVTCHRQRVMGHRT